jgi:hypothetical protein
MSAMPEPTGSLAGDNEFRAGWAAAHQHFAGLTDAERVEVARLAAAEQVGTPVDSRDYRLVAGALAYLTHIRTTNRGANS